MAGERSEQSNIFGQTTTTSSSGNSEPSNTETTAAGKLIAHLKWVADSHMEHAANRANWLALAANQGQNNHQDSLVKGELLKPHALNRAGALASWTVPQIQAPELNLPSVPEELVVDFDRLHAQFLEDLNGLRNTWIAQYLPTVTDLSALNLLSGRVLDGTQANAAAVKLDGLEAATKAALDAIVNAARLRLSTAVDLMRTNLVANSATAKTGVTTALALANDETREIAWVRARDQAAREAARNEAEGTGLWASRGFSLPGGALTSMAMKAQQATLDAASDMAAKEAEKSQDMYFKVATEHIGAWLRIMDSQATSEIQAYRTNAEMDLRFAELELDANKVKARQAFEHLGLQLDFTKFSADLAVKYRLGAINAVNDLIRAYVAVRGNETDGLNAIANAKREQLRTMLDYYRAAVASAEIGMKVDLANNETDLRWATIAAQFIGQSVGHHVSAAATAAEVFSRTAGMALSGLNGIASVASST